MGSREISKDIQTTVSVVMTGMQAVPYGVTLLLPTRISLSWHMHLLPPVSHSSYHYGTLLCVHTEALVRKQHTHAIFKQISSLDSLACSSEGLAQK